MRVLEFDGLLEIGGPARRDRAAALAMVEAPFQEAGAVISEARAS
jgi:hypothetical protein